MTYSFLKQNTNNFIMLFTGNNNEYMLSEKLKEIAATLGEDSNRVIIVVKHKK